MTPAARALADVVYLDRYRPSEPPAVGGEGHRRDSLAVCWHRSQLRRDLIERGTGLLVGVVLLAALLFLLSVMGVMPA